jgi:intracellular sulfur oxidation DsrE/DsrF family protein
MLLGRLDERRAGSVDRGTLRRGANAIGSAQFVPAGIVAVTRAQEHGYALVSIG